MESIASGRIGYPLSAIPVMEALQYLLMGAVFGLTAGISPGPLLVLVISETLRHNRKAGLRIAITPLITDVPIIALSLFVFSGLSHYHSVLSIISMAGGCFIAYLGYETVSTRGINGMNPRSKLLTQISRASPGELYQNCSSVEGEREGRLKIEKQNPLSGSIQKGILANFLSPHPYLFWITVGAPSLIKAFESSLLSAILFLLSFYIFMVGSKIGVAFLADRSKSLLNNRTYIWIMRFLGIVLFIFSIFFLKDGITQLISLSY